MKRNILVTGAHGFVGHHLVKELYDQNYDILSVDRTPSAQSSPYIKHAYTADLTDPEAVSQISFKDIDGIVHLAGLAAVGPSFDDPSLYIQVNMGAEINLFEAAQSQNAKPRFVIISSGSLYDPRAELPLSETSHVAPNSPYAVSKLGQEQLAAYYGNRGFEYIVARPFNHIGPGQGLGFLLPDLAKQAVDVELGKSSEILVGNLDAQRDYTDVRDIVRAYRLLLEKGKSGETYNICSGKPTSGNAILKAILQATVPNAHVTQDPARMRPADAPVIYGNSSKLGRDTGWKPELDIQTTITDVVADWRSRLNTTDE